MNVVDLDGNSYLWQLTGCLSHGKITNKSDLHLSARSLIKELFPTLQILEEVPIKITRSETLFLDFYLPLIKTCVEVHGEQHYKFVKFYHQNMIGFAKSKKRDSSKTEWCNINNIKQIILPHYESIEQWKDRLNGYENS
jgi:hypothetical protein